MKVIDLSIIIISFNTKALLRECLIAVYRTVRGISFEVIVVDNASLDGSIDMVRNEFADAQVIVNEKNLGFAKANNQALAISKGEFILLLNSDAFLQENTVEILIGHLRNHPRAAVAGPRVLNPDGSLQSKGGSFPSVQFALLRLFRLHSLLPQRALQKYFSKLYWSDKETRIIDVTMGCCMLLRKKVFAKVGFLSEDFFMYGEEDEWCWRVKHNGYETWYVAAAEVKHLNESSFAPNRMQQRVLARSKFYKNTNTLWCGSLICIIDLIYYATSIVSIVFKSMFSRASKSHLRLYINALIRESVLFKQIIMGLLASTSSPGSIEIR